MKIIRIIVMLTGVIGTALFLPPVFTKGIVNIGNITGIVVGALILLYGVFMPKINELISNLWQRKAGKIFIVLAAIFLITIVALAVIISVLMIKANSSKNDKNGPAIVLGCAVYGEKPSLMLEKRLEAAYDYMKENPYAVCVLSGGKGKGEDISEAECMYRYLVKRGIDKDQLIKEENSTSTRENILYSKQILDEYNFDEKTTIITNEFHEYRAMKIAKTLNMRAAAVSGKTPFYLFPTYCVREMYGIEYEWILELMGSGDFRKYSEDEDYKELGRKVEINGKKYQEGKTLEQFLDDYTIDYKKSDAAIQEGKIAGDLEDDVYVVMNPKNGKGSVYLVLENQTSKDIDIKDAIVASIDLHSKE